MNFEKTKTMVFGEKEPTGKLLIDGRHLENVEQFTYLGSNTTYDLDNMREVRTRPAKATAALKAMEKVWKSRSLEIETKKRVLQTCVFSILLYGCEAWVVTKEIEQRIMAFERKCYRKILRIGCTLYTENKEHRLIWSNTAKGEYHAETDRQKTRTVWTHYAECITTGRQRSCCLEEWRAQTR